MTVATLTSKFQISIPKQVRDQLDWKAGQKLTFKPKGQGLLLVPVPTLEGLKGLALNADKSGYRDRRERLS